MGAASIVSAVVLLLLCVQFAVSAKLRVRKEIRNLTPKEYGMYIQALATMVSVPTATGQMLFGNKYHDMSDILVVHAINALDPVSARDEGLVVDISHFGPWFMNFHKALELLFESSVLAVVPDLKAIPYWKMYEDLAGGRYYNTPQTVFNKKYAGSLPGDPEHGYAVMDGPFAARQIGNFNYYKYKSISTWYNGSSLGLMRGPYNLNSNPLFTRFPAEFQDPTGPIGPFSLGLHFPYKRSDFMRCANPKLVKSAWDFVKCIDLPTTVLVGLPYDATWMSHTSAQTHGMFHGIIGSTGPDNGAVNSTVPNAQIVGDPRDLATSPNDVILFIPHHANLDRLWMIWQNAIKKVDPSAARKDVLWGYPKYHSTVPPTVLNNTALYDVISWMRPFVGILPGNPPDQVVTHYDVLTWEPDYTYDDMTPYKP